MNSTFGKGISLDREITLGELKWVTGETTPFIPIIANSVIYLYNMIEFFNEINIYRAQIDGKLNWTWFYIGTLISFSMSQRGSGFGIYLYTIFFVK